MPRFDNAPSGLNKLLEQAYAQCLEQRASTTEKDCTVCEQIALDLARKYGWSQNPDTGLWECGTTNHVPLENADHAQATERASTPNGHP